MELSLKDAPIEQVSKLLRHESVLTTVKHHSSRDLRQQKLAEADVVKNWKDHPTWHELPRTESARFRQQPRKRLKIRTRNNGGEGGIRPIECGALHPLAWACWRKGNKALTWISASARSYRRVLKANLNGECSTAMENVARHCSSTTPQFSC